MVDSCRGSALGARAPRSGVHLKTRELPFSAVYRGKLRGPARQAPSPNRQTRTRPPLVRLTSAERRAPSADSIHTLHHRRREPRERTDVADAVPRILAARRLALGFVSLQESRHEELLRQRGQPDAARSRRSRRPDPGRSGSTTSIIARGAGG